MNFVFFPWLLLRRCSLIQCWNCHFACQPHHQRTLSVSCYKFVSFVFFLISYLHSNKLFKYWTWNLVLGFADLLKKKKMISWIKKIKIKWNEMQILSPLPNTTTKRRSPFHLSSIAVHSSPGKVYSFDFTRFGVFEIYTRFQPW